jgi:hypothetical protein
MSAWCDLREQQAFLAFPKSLENETPKSTKNDGVAITRYRQARVR